MSQCELIDILPTVFVQVRHFGMSELSSDVGIPQQPLQDEHSQAQRVVVVLQGDQLSVDCLQETQGVQVLTRQEQISYGNIIDV